MREHHRRSREAQGNPAGFAKRQMPILHILSKCSKYKIPHRVDKRKEQKLAFLLFNIWYTQRKRQGIKLSPGKSHLPPGEIFPVSPVAKLPRIPKIYSNGTQRYFHLVSIFMFRICYFLGFAFFTENVFLSSVSFTTGFSGQYSIALTCNCQN